MEVVGPAHVGVFGSGGCNRRLRYGRFNERMNRTVAIDAQAERSQASLFELRGAEVLSHAHDALGCAQRLLGVLAMAGLTQNHFAGSRSNLSRP